MKISKNLSDSIFIGSFICTLLVVAIHYNSKDHINTEILGVGANYYFQEFLTNGIARVAVPYFAIISGFFFFLKYRGQEDFKRNIKSRFWTLFIPYLLTSLLFFLVESLYQYLLKDKPPYQSVLDMLSVILLAPVSVQHWFLRDLMILSLISPILLFLKNSSLSSTLLILLIGLWISDIEFMPKVGGRYLIQIEVLACFTLGALLSDHATQLEEHLKRTRLMTIILLLCLYFILTLIRVYIQPDFMNYYHDHYTFNMLLLQNITKFTGIYLVFLISYRTHSELLLKMSSFSFFLFLFHGIPLNRIVNKFSDFFLDDAYKFYLNFPLSVILTLLLASFIARFLPGIYGILTGNRSKRILNVEP